MSRSEPLRRLDFVALSAILDALLPHCGIEAVTKEVRTVTTDVKHIPANGLGAVPNFTLQMIALLGKRTDKRLARCFMMPPHENAYLCGGTPRASAIARAMSCSVIGGTQQ